MKLNDAIDLKFGGTRVKRVYLNGFELYIWNGVLRTHTVSSYAELFSTSSEWTYDATRGWYRNIRDFKKTPVDSLAYPLSQIRRIEADFTSHPNTPAGSMGHCLFNITLDDDSVVTMGSQDAWTNQSSGQWIHNPQYPGIVEPRTTSSVVGRTLYYDVPEGRTVVSITLEDRGYSVGGTNYPFTARGVKNLKITRLDI